MTAIYGFGAKLSGCLAGVCAVLALLATPSSARADQFSDCMTFCQDLGLTGQDFSKCMGDCLVGQCSNMTCNLTCSGSFPQCGTGTCSTGTQACPSCSCMLIMIGGVAKFCECH